MIKGITPQTENVLSALSKLDLMKDLLIKKAANYSGHALKTKNIISLLSKGQQFVKDERFKHLNPFYDVSYQEIEDFIKSEFLRTTI